MDCSESTTAFLCRSTSLPTELVKVIEDGSNNQYLNTLSRLALQAEYTTDVYCYFENIFPELCARWATLADASTLIQAYARILPVAPHLADPLLALLRSKGDSVGFLNTILDEYADPSNSLGNSHHLLAAALLCIYRLLEFDNSTYSKFLRPAQIQLLLKHPDRSVRYLVVRITGLYLHASDAMLQGLIASHLGHDAVNGLLDGELVDYSFLALLEEERLRDLRRQLLLLRNSRAPDLSTADGSRVIEDKDFSLCIANICGRLIPCISQPSPSTNKGQALVLTESTRTNARALADAVVTSRAILVTGQAGCGKTTIIDHVARQLGKGSSMVTLHLNEQSDAKLLLGIYTTGDQPGSFKWQPGVLATAVREGRWVLVEDLDHASDDVLGLLLPLIERGELRMPGEDEVVKASTGFRLLATMRSHIGLQGQEIISRSRITSSREWHCVPFTTLGTPGLSIIIAHQFPELLDLMPRILETWQKLRQDRPEQPMNKHIKHDSARPISARDLVKWCVRMQTMLSTSGFKQGTGAVSEQVIDYMLLDAIDCFLGYLKGGSEARQALTACIAEVFHIDSKRTDHLVEVRKPTFEHTSARASRKVRIGRARLTGQIDRNVLATNGLGKTFSLNKQTCKLMEQIAVAVRGRESLLLVGETGIGKTTAIQHLASVLGQQMLAINMSQQSETGDLLGGYKPVSIRIFVMPLKDEFDELFAQTFSERKNVEYAKILSKAISKSQWRRVLSLWKEALKNVEKHFASPNKAADASKQRNKRRKVDVAGQSTVEVRWAGFSARVDNLQRRLKASSTSFAFSFVEGELVKAVRNGSWILLDEINLASPDTLESLSDLLEAGPDKRPSLLLTETGSTEHIEAHPNFRLFAAMNPSTDVGKKDLPLGIRSRFTEIYVESPDRDRSSLVDITESYVCGSSPTAPLRKMCSSVADLYMEIAELVERRQLVDGSGQRPQYSLRSLTRALSHAVTIAPVCTMKRGLYEGLTMCFATSLDAKSEALLQIRLKTALFHEVAQGDAELRRPLPPPSERKDYITFNLRIESVGGAGKVREEQHWLPRGREPPQSSDNYIITPFIVRNMRNLIRATSTRKYPVLIQGPTSAGKTSMVGYLAHRSGNKLVRINNHEHTDLQEYLGTYVSTSAGQIVFQEGILVQALRNGDWVVLDELNLAPTDVLEALNRLLDDNRELLIPETQEVVKPHPNFMLFATQNPVGAYGGRKTLSRAFRNRFLELQFEDIPVSELHVILCRRSSLPESRCKMIIEVHNRLSTLRTKERIFERNSHATLRDLFRWALRGGESVQELAENGFMLLAERVRKPVEKHAVKQVIEETMSGKGVKVQLDEDILYRQIDAEQAVGQTQIVWTKAMKRLFALVGEAVRHDEPVLLVGDTGGGKTTVCQFLAIMMSKELHTVNAHQNMETGDLIGAQRPIRDRSTVEADLQNDLRAVFRILNMPFEHFNNIAEALSVYDALDDKSMQAIPGGMREAIIAKRNRRKALFEWQDGSLIHAMREGQFFLIDEISLADDSVLERLNSLLDPQRSILLAEKGTSDSLVTAQPGFQLLATMNPGGDFGKKELSPALRNRFTEIWVEPMSDKVDILNIVEANIRTDAVCYAQAVVDFSTWFNEHYGSSRQTSVSVRDILAWLNFLDACQLEAGQAVVHGAMTVFIDTLGANPSALVTLSKMAVTAERQRCLNVLGSMLKINVFSFLDLDPKLSIDTTDFRVGPFFLAINNTSQTNSHYTFQSPTTKLNAMRILRAMKISKPILLEGAPGVGKTSIVTALARCTGHHLTRINLSEQTDLMDLFGSDVPVEDSTAGTFTWRDAPFLTAMKRGSWVLLDEMNLASQSVLEGLNACIDHRGEVYISELDKTFPRHAGFRLFAAQNPHHQGGGRKGLPISFVNRFTLVFMESFKPDDLQTICANAFPHVSVPLIEMLIHFVATLNQRLAERRQFGARGSPWEFNLRDILRCLCLLGSSEGLLQAGEPHDYLEILFAQRFRTETDRQAVKTMIVSVLGERHHPRSFCTDICSSTVQIGIGLLSRRKDLGFSMKSFVDLSPQRLPLLEALIVSVNEQWPVLLVGPTEADKAGLLESLAALAGVDINFLAINADLDANDLIGSFEQSDPLRHVQAFLAHTELLIRRLLTQVMPSPLRGSDRFVSILLEVLSCASSKHTRKEKVASVASHLASAKGILQEYEHSFNTDTTSELLRTVSELYQRSSEIAEVSLEPTAARFEWIDGTLVKAVERGSWVVLDNANLCSSSVLDRLNSLLEVDGSLIINEHSAEDGAARTIKPHANFRIFLTMDPLYGEISRAMRNRVVELFVQPLVHGSGFIVNNTPLESSLVGHAQLLDVCRSLPIDGLLNWSCLYAFQRQRREDLHVLGRLLKQVRDLLPPQLAELLASIAHKYDMISEMEPTCLNTASHRRSNAQYSPPIHALTNPPLALLPEEAMSHHGPFSLGLFHDCQYETAEIDLMLQRMRSEPQSSTNLSVGRLNRSRMKEMLILDKARKTFVQCLSRVAAEGRRDIAQAAFKAVLQLLRLYRLMLEAFESLDDDKHTLNIYVTVIKDLVLGMSPRTTELQELCQSFGDALALISPSTALTTGLSIERIWKMYKPPIPYSAAGLDNLIALEDIADRLDTMTLTSITSASELLELRKSIIQAGNNARCEHRDTSHLVQKLGAIMDEQTLAASGGKSVAKPHFREVFGAICCFTAPGSPPSSITNAFNQELVGDMQILGRIATKLNFGIGEANKLQSCLFSLSACLHADEGGMQSFVDFSSLLQGAFSAVEIVPGVPLEQVNLLQHELSVLGNFMAGSAPTICHGQQSAIRRQLQNFLDSILFAHSDLLSMSPTENGQDPCQNRSTRQLRDGVPRNHYFAQMLDKYLLTADLCSTHDPSSDRAWLDLGRQVVGLAIGTLCLYVPDRAHDPAQQSLIERVIYERRIQEAKDQVAALSRVEVLSTGQTRNLRTEFITAEIKSLGPAPKAYIVFRPEVPQITELQGGFDSVLRLVDRAGQAFEQARLYELGTSGFLDNTFRMKNKLSEEYRAYDDITNTAVGLLQLLSLGLSIIVRFSQPPHSISHRLQGLLPMVPFVNIDLKQWSQGHSSDIHRSSGQGSSMLEATLKTLAVRAQVQQPLDWPRLVQQTLVETLNSSFHYWKEKLGVDQRREAKDSSLYHYRGGEDAQDAADEKNFLHLFPSFDTNDRNEDDLVDQRQQDDQPLKAATVARLHHDIFLDAGASGSRMLRHVHFAGQVVSHSSKNRERVASFSAETLLPLVLILQRQKQVVCHPAISSKDYNIYTNPNLAEALRLRSVVEDTKSRVEGILQVWPEHATLHNIVMASEELLSSRHSDPLAKYLTKAEQLHAYVAEWQTVASSEVTLAAHYNDLTSLLVSWRRLELSTWARLLDIELEKCDEEARSWWYVAYENIVVIPSSLDLSVEEVQSHTANLMSTLESLLRTSSMGQYGAKLRIIASLCKQLAYLPLDQSISESIANALDGLMAHYERFLPSVGDSIAKERAVLEKEVKNVIQLASWKDANIVSLRQSAKASHRKLFSIIRKFRQLLGRPVESTLRVANAAALSATLIPLLALENAEPDQSALLYCQNHIGGWASRPSRFRNVSATANMMTNLCASPSHRNFDASSYVQDFITTIEGSAKHLREETPSICTEENTAAVKHLGARKRRLFADTIKDLRHMGIRSSQNTNVLSLQSSLANIVTNSPLQHFSAADTDATEADAFLHSALGRMPQIRLTSREHNKDLTPSDVARSIGMLEGLLALALKQRRGVMKIDAHRTTMQLLVAKTKTVWKDGSCNLVLASSDAVRDMLSLSTVAAWLPTITKTGAQLLEAQAQCGGLDFSAMITSLERFSAQFESIRVQLVEGPIMPKHLNTKSALVFKETFKQAVEQLESDIKSWCEATPAAKLVLEQILVWTRYENDDQVNGLHCGGTPAETVDGFDADLFKTLDDILASMQDVQAALESYPSSTQDPEWMMKSDTVQLSISRALHRTKISSALDNLVDRLQGFDHDDQAQFETACASLALAVPIIEQYSLLQQQQMFESIKFYRATTNMLSKLSEIFCTLASDGFCKPAEKSDSGAHGKEQLESGTGLGDGEGAEDISKDIADDEDLSELAQDPQNAGEKNDQEGDDGNDAINAGDELEGGHGSAGKEQEEDVTDGEDDNATSDRGLDSAGKDEGEMEDDGEAEDDAAADERVGGVDEFEPSAVDEKYWDEAGDEDKKQKAGKQEASAKGEDDTSAGKDRQVEDKDGGKDELDLNATGKSDAGSEDDSEDTLANDPVTPPQNDDVMDPHIHESEGLDLPEDMNLDGDKNTGNQDDDSDMDLMSEQDVDDHKDLQEDLRQDETNAEIEPSDEEIQGVDHSAEVDENMPDASEENDDTMEDRNKDQQDNSTKPYASEQMGDDDAEPSGTAQGTDGTDTMAGESQAVHEQVAETDEQVDDAEAPAEANQDRTDEKTQPLGKTRAGQSQATQRSEDPSTSRNLETFKKMAEVLEKYHRQHRPIRETTTEGDNAQARQDVDVGDADLEHLPDEDAEADAQALGATSTEQARAVDESMVLPDQQPSDGQEYVPDDFLPDAEEMLEHGEAEDVDMQDSSTANEQQAEDQVRTRTATMGKSNNDQNQDQDMHQADEELSEERLEDVSEDLQDMQIQLSGASSPTHATNTTALWAHHEASTHALALILTEQLRLILAPTLATKLRGDFRTGKRLNLKRIIPYIASSYKRDKIWMRRSVPSKRTYQIQLAIDDSKSMGENGREDLAFSTLALIARALTMLESGEVGVVGFGKSVFVAHELGMPFTAGSGAEVLGRFGFEQTSTDVRKLVRDSIDLFQDARMRSQNATDLWQLQLIISDGICEDHEGIRRLLLEAQEERIMFVFVIVDAASEKEGVKGKAKGPKQSITNLETAEFVEGPKGEDGEPGESKLVMRSYLETFPFRYYLIVKDVEDLPDVLAAALRQWFAEVAET